MERNTPAANPQALPEPPPKDKPVGSESEGSNAVQHEPNPAADRRPPQREDGRAPRGPYPTGNT